MKPRGDWTSRLRDRLLLVRLSRLMLIGRKGWVLPLLPLVWLGFQALLVVLGDDGGSFEPKHAQTLLIGLPLTVMGLFLGSRVLAGELDRRTIEIAYTVPGGAHRIWFGKMAAAIGLLLAAEALTALVVYLFLTPFPLGALYGAFQGALVYFCLAMGLAALARSEVAGLLMSVMVLVLNGVLTGLGGLQTRFSPFLNLAALEPAQQDRALAWALQNRIGFLLVIAALIALAFLRAERRERMLA